MRWLAADRSGQAAETAEGGDRVDDRINDPVELPRPADWKPPSWEEVVRVHSSRVYRLAYRLTGNQHDAEDLTQEVFVRVFRSLSNYTPGTFEGWLHRITTNLFLDSVRRRQRIRFEGFADDAPERLPGREPSPEKWYDERTFDADIQAALDALHPDFRAAVVLCDIEGLSYEEIAATLGVKLGTVRSRIHRGRSHLKAALEHRAATRRRSGRAGGTGGPDPGGSVSAGSDGDHAADVIDLASRRTAEEDTV
jgi:RNA polymerase sigma factor (sigma-70 family)